MLVKAIRGFSPATGGPIAPGDVFTLPAGADWLKAGLVEKADAGAKETRFVEPQESGERPGSGIREAVKEVLEARADGAKVTPEKVDAAVRGIKEKKAATARKQAAKAKKKAA